MTAANPRPSGACGKEWTFYDDTLDCVHCGLCLSACPTYDVLGLETDSPRGRIFLMRALAEGRIEEPEEIREHLDQCLGCLACESACPSGVRYGQILEASRGALEARSPAKGWKDRVRRFALTHVVAKQGRLRMAVRAARVFEVLGLRRLAVKFGLAPELSAHLMPSIPKGTERAPLRGTFEPQGEARGTVALFTGCVMEQMFGDLNRKTRDLLVANGFRVEVVAAQVCCGALLLHDGQMEKAKELARANVAAFERAEVVIHNAAGCGNAMRDYGHLLDDEGAKALAAKCRDVCEFLAEVGLTAVPKAFPYRVAYDDPCHLCHGQGVRQQPRELLAKVPGMEMVEHADAERCCGSAGIYNLNHEEIAAEIGREKAERLVASGAEVVVTGNPGCIMQIRAHLGLRGVGVRVCHPVELLLPG